MNSAGFDKLYEACYMRVFSYAMTLAKDRHLAEEITQETFFRAFAKLNSFRGESDEVTWLCAIAKNLFADEKRRQSRFGELPEDAAARQPGVEQAVAEKGLLGALTGGLTATAGGITAAVLFSLIAALLVRPGDKR